MEVGRPWLMKKNPAFYLFDIAILLALFRQIDIDNLFVSSRNREFLHHNGPLVNLLPPVIHTHQFEGDLFHRKISALNYDNVHNDYRAIMDDAHRRIPRVVQHAQNSTNNTNSVHGRNITALVLQFPESEVVNATSDLNDWDRSAMEASFNVETENNVLNSMNATQLNIFETMLPNGHGNFSELLTNSQNSEQSYNNSDDVRWREYLTEHNTTTKLEEKVCETNNTDPDCIDIGILDDIEINSVPDTRLRTTSEVSEESGIGLLESSEFKPPPVSHHASQDDGQQEAWNPDILFHLNQGLNDVSSEETDLLQMMYQQDIDLGYSLHHSYEPVKQSNDADDVQKLNDNTLDTVNYTIDGETGEHIQIVSPSNPSATTQETEFSHPVVTQVDTNDTLNIEECLELLENSVDDVHPQRVENQAALDNQNNLIRNLTSLINESDTNATTQPTDDLWQHIAGLSELAGLDLPIQNNQPQFQVQNDSTFRNSPNLQLPNTTNEQPFPFYGQLNYLGNGSSPAAVPSATRAYNSPAALPDNNFNISLNTPVMSSPASSDYGVPMDIGFPSTSSSPETQDSNYGFEQLNDFTLEMASNQTYARPPPLSFSDPGRSFFDLTVKGDMPHLESFNSSQPSFSDNMDAPHLNPAPLQRPILLPSSPFSYFSNESDQRHPGRTTVDDNAVSDCSESDSGVSSELSPRDFSSAEGQQWYSSGQGTNLRTLKSINHNHTYNGTDGVRKPVNKKKHDPSQPRESRDERKARELDLPFTLEEIVSSPVEEYNEMLLRSSLNSAQQALIKDIRRRGKNKVAAQNCRKRKINTIHGMEENVDVLRSRKQQLVDEQNHLEAQKEQLKARYNTLCQQVFSSIQDDLGRSYDPNHYRLEQAGGLAIIVPRMGQAGGPALDEGESNRKINFSKVKTEKSQ